MVCLEHRSVYWPQTCTILRSRRRLVFRFRHLLPTCSGEPPAACSGVRRYRKVSVKSCVVGLAALAAMSAAVPQQGASACQLEPGEIRAVARVQDSETLTLDDGSEVRLIGALGPRPEDANADALFWQPAVTARGALEALVAGRSVVLERARHQPDRHGRRLAHVFTATDPPVWVQGYMVENGHARAYALPGAGDCLDALARLEARARTVGLGLWSNAAYSVRSAERTWQLNAGQSRFHLVEGTVASARQIRGHVHLNFGSDWRRDFTVEIGPEVRRDLARRGIDPAALTGRLVRVRGWMVRRNGPMIAISHAGDIEVIGPAAEAGANSARPPR